MNTSELERRLGEVLRDHAEEAMDDTDTQTRLETLHNRLDHDQQRPRTARIGFALAAAAAVVAAVVLVNARADDRTDTPAAPVDTQAAEDVASDFMAALAAYDADRAASYLADDARIELRISTVDAESMSRLLPWARAAGIRLLPERCAVVNASAQAASLACVFDAHGLGSERLGRGPFTDNVLRLTVVDDEIVSGVEDAGSDGSQAFEVTMWEPFTAWLLSNHADEAAFMYADWPGWPLTLPAWDGRSARLWTKNIDEYVRAVERGDAY
jgi:hypothetical protein